MPVDLEKIESLVEPIAASIGCELVACEWVNELGKWILRVLIDKKEGVLVRDCENLSYLLDPVLDVEDLIPQKYHLEISSPGLERPLKKLSDFVRFTGHKIKLNTQVPVESRRHFKGRLEAVKDKTLLLEVEGRVYEIPHSSVNRAHLLVEWKEAFKKR